MSKGFIICYHCLFGHLLDHLLGHFYIMLDSVNIVLSHTSHPGNIGAAARAMAPQDHGLCR